MISAAPGRGPLTPATPRFPLGDLLKGITPRERLPEGLADTGITGLSLDSRRIEPGNAFVAIPGRFADGREHVVTALESGARAVLFESDHASEVCRRLAHRGHAVGVSNLKDRVGLMASRLYADPSAHLRVLGITGTNGKTTCAWLLAQALNQLGERCVMMGTLGAGFPGALAAASLTTPDAVAVHRNLRDWLDQGATAVCMEVSSHGLDQGRVNAVHFHTALFTNLTRDHLDYHGDMQAYAEAKKKLFGLLGLEAVVTNTDEALGRDILNLTDAPMRITYGRQGADIRPLNPHFQSTGTQFDWEWHQHRFRIRSRLLGEMNLPNLLAVIATLLAQGYAAEQVARVMPKLGPPPGRMEWIPGRGNGPVGVVDYAHTPDALAQALTSLRPLTPGCLTVVFGCGGERDPGKRRLMGAVAARHADRIWITSDNPRNEDPQVIADMIHEGVLEEGSAGGCEIEIDRARAITRAIRQGRADDVVLVAGKGHETTQIMGAHRMPFCDRDVVRSVLGSLS